MGALGEEDCMKDSPWGQEYAPTDESIEYPEVDLVVVEDEIEWNFSDFFSFFGDLG